MIKISVVSRIMFKNGDYVATINGNRIEMVFSKNRVAKVTFDAMKNANMNPSYDGERTIINVVDGVTEKELLEATKKELDFVIANKLPIQKVSYTIEEIR